MRSYSLHIIRILILLALLLFLTPLCVSSEQEKGTAERIRAIENGLVSAGAPDLRAMLAAGDASRSGALAIRDEMGKFAIPGLSIAVIDGYRLDWARAYGVRAAGGGEALDTESMFEAASTTKLLTAVIALILVEQGQLDLDADINTMLKTWRVPENEFTQAHPVTLRLLLSHRAGINRPDGGFDYEDGSCPTLDQVLTGAGPSKTQPARVEFEPGSAWQYSNMGFVIVQKLLEDISGRSYAELARELVFDPLGMSHSTVSHPLTAAEKERWARPHDAAGQAHDRMQMPNAVAHGGLVTTPSDLALLLAELMRAEQGTSTVIPHAVAQRMFNQEVALDREAMFGLDGQGLAAFIIGDGPNRYVASLGFNTPGSLCVLLASPAHGVGAVIMCNASEVGFMLVAELIPAIAREYAWPSLAP
jgi:CubicO group peptidase (beta-lactamase class C family)